MPKQVSHIPYIATINEFFVQYGLSEISQSEIICMRLGDQSDERLIHMPLSRANFYRVIFFTNSGLKFWIGEKEYSIIDNCLCFTYPGKLESWTRSGKLHGYVVYFTAEFAGLDVTHRKFEVDFPYFNFNSESMLPLLQNEAEELKRMAEEMVAELDSNHSDKLEFTKKLLHIYLHKITRIYQQHINTFSVAVKENKSLFNKFRKELDDYMQLLINGKKEFTPTVSILANQLFVNASYLNSVIKNSTGKTASIHIQEKLILEAKSFLLHTNLQASEIAFKLGFESNAYFCNFFKKNTGISPIGFRKTHILR